MNIETFIYITLRVMACLLGFAAGIKIGVYLAVVYNFPFIF